MISKYAFQYNKSTLIIKLFGYVLFARFSKTHKLRIRPSGKKRFCIPIGKSVISISKAA